MLRPGSSLHTHMPKTRVPQAGVAVLLSQQVVVTPTQMPRVESVPLLADQGKVWRFLTFLLTGFLYCAL